MKEALLNKLVEKIIDSDSNQESKEEYLGKRIVVLQRGWVYIGELYKNGEYMILKNAFNIRRWGTTNGLGEIAINGITSDTVLDKTPDVEFHELTVINTIKCLK